MSLEFLLQEPYKAYQEAHYDALEMTLEDALHAVLEWNATRHAKESRFDHAMASALKLIRMYPNSASGYLQAGDIQGEKCDYRQAARYYARGVAAGVSHPDLKTRLAAAQRRRDRLIDPLDVLPGEIVSKILCYVPDKRVLCTRLSKQWRATLLSLPMWQSLDIRLMDVASQGYWQQGLLQYLKPHLRHLVLRTNSEVCLATSALSMAHCHNIQTIEVVDTSHYNPDRSTDGLKSFVSRSFFRDVASLSETLTHLSIQSCMRPRNVLRILLSLCPKLVSLCYKMISDATHLVPAWDTTYLPPSTLTDLQHLTWPSVVDLVTDPFFLPRYCPQLTSIHMCGYEDHITDISTLADELEKSCPRLQLLDFSADMPGTVTERGQHEQHSQELHRDSDGLVHLVIGGEVTISGPVLCRLLKNNQTSLEHFLYELDEDQPLIEAELSVARPIFDFPHMRLLSIHTHVPDAIGPLHSFLRACPALETVYFSYVDVSRDVMQALLECPLRKLKLSYCDGDAQNTLQFIHALAERVSPLTELELRCSDPDGIWDEEVFIAIGSLTGLQRLHLSGSSGLLSQEALEAFVQNAVNSGLLGTVKEFYCPPRLFPNLGVRNPLKDFFGPAYISSIK